MDLVTYGKRSMWVQVARFLLGVGCMYVQLKKKKEALCPEQTRKEAAEESDPGLDFVSCIVLAST